jgi:hypothetical protein
MRVPSRTHAFAGVAPLACKSHDMADPLRQPGLPPAWLTPYFHNSFVIILPRPAMDAPIPLERGKIYSPGLHGEGVFCRTVCHRVRAEV